MSTRKAAMICQRNSLKVSPTSIHRVLHSFGLIAHRPIRKTFLTTAHRKKRLIFAKKYLDHDWRNTIVTDEKHFPLFSHPNCRNGIVWDKPGAEWLWPQLGHPPEIHVWGGILYYGVCCLIEYKGNLNAEYYQEVLLEAHPSITALFERQK